MHSRKLAEYLFHHVFLPPKTPQKNDSAPEFGHAFFDVVQKALHDFKEFPIAFSDVPMGVMEEMFQTIRSVHHPESQDIIEDELRAVVGRLADKGGMSAVFVRAQNAGIIIRNQDGLRFELFEVSPPNEKVMTTKGRLIRCFPESALVIDSGTATDLNFQHHLAAVLSQLSHQHMPGQLPQVTKAKKMLDETRDTSHPGMVTEIFRSIIAGIGGFVKSDSITKHTREQVSWLDAKEPWRRAPMWLFTRVALQLGFVRLAENPEIGRALYKKFMVFLISRIVQLSPRSSLPSEHLYAMNAKLARRANKIPDLDDCLLDAVRKTAAESQQHLMERWSRYQEADRRKLCLSSLTALDFERDAVLDIPEVVEFVRTLKNTEVNTAAVLFQPQSASVTFHPDVLPVISGSGGSVDIVLKLHAVECWVAEHLPGWRVQNSGAESCAQLGALLQQYHRTASRAHSGNPEAMSEMVLVTLELWKACDEVAVEVEPLLKEYDPGVPYDVSQSLLLPFRGQTERLHAVEQYLSSRTQAPRSSALLFDRWSPNAFAARYFDGSSEHQNLQQKIVFHANDTRKRKLVELQKKRNEYERLMQSYHDRASCDFTEVWVDYDADGPETRHSTNCGKCGDKMAASKLEISVHEWPLPEDSIEAKTVVFELRAPRWYGHWRDALLYLRHDILAAEHCEKIKVRSTHHLSNDPHLSRSYFQGQQGSRVGLLSEVKPHVGTHRRGRELINSTEANVCLPSGLKYRYFDSQSQCFIGGLQLTDAVQQACTYRMPPTATALQKFLWRPASEPHGPPPNMVYASQSECPDHFNLPEYKELCDIPYGIDLQWRNILTQLVAPTVNFQRVETAFVLLQCAYQTGPPPRKSSYRGGFLVFEDETFPPKLISGLQQSLLRIRDSWVSVPSLDILIAIARRVLTLTGSENARIACVAYLADARAVAMRWIGQLQHECQNAQNETDRQYFRERIAEAALVCASSFDVDPRFRSEVLDTTQATILLQCSILVYYGKHLLDSCTSQRNFLLRRRHQCMLFDVHQLLSVNMDALDDAVKETCGSFCSVANWNLAERTSHWMVSDISADPADKSQIHLDLLTGELLVDGAPLDRLPKLYEKHPRYRDLFGRSTIEVNPTRRTGMSFASRRKYRDCNLEFALRSTSHGSSTDLLVRATSENTTYTLLPARLFRGVVPDALVDEFVHWYDGRCGTVEFRPRMDPWATDSPDRWVLQNRGEDSEWQLERVKDRAVLASSKSETAQMLSHIFAPLAQPPRIHICYQRSFPKLSIEFQDLRLGFYLSPRSSKLISREYSTMSVDEDQSIGTLVGFFNKIILREDRGSRRMALVADGAVTASSVTDRFTMPTVETCTAATRTHAFHVDARLGHLEGNGSLESRLVAAYLHAHTSFCLPDPLTHKTGTEQALSILTSAAVRSFEHLAECEVRWLERIALLTPRREFYPDNERVMESITWSQTHDFLSQHASLYRSVEAILNHARKTQFFYPDSQVEIPLLRGVHPDLLDRDCIRSSTFRVSGFGAEDFNTRWDVTYLARPKNANSAKVSDVEIISRLVYNGIQTRNWRVPAEDAIWSLLTEASTVHGPNHPLPAHWLKFDAKYIQDGQRFVAKHWAPLHEALCDQTCPSADRYGVIMWLAALICSNLSVDIIALLVLLYTSPSFKAHRAPRQPHFQLSNGSDVRDMLDREIRSHFIHWQKTPDRSIARLLNEPRHVFNARRTRLYQQHLNEAIDFIVSEFRRQWPCREPSTPSACGSMNVYSYIAQNDMTSAVVNKFRSCFDNRQLREYLHTLRQTAAVIPLVPYTPSQSIFSALASTPSLPGFISCTNIFRGPPPQLTRLSGLCVNARLPSTHTSFPRLQTFVDSLEDSHHGSPFKKEYLTKLRDSLTALQAGTNEDSLNVPSLEVLRAYEMVCHESVHNIANALMETVQAVGDSAFSLQVGQYPRVGNELFLRQLSRTRWAKLDQSWRRCIVDFAISITNLQRAERMVEACATGKAVMLAREWQNEGHANWDVLQYPESLLLEVESGIMIRDVQEQIAAEMREPSNGASASMQLNMGEGKSSVIIPIVAAALADERRLVRVVVAKPQSKQMAQMLIAKLGGMLDRRVFHMPFSRSLGVDQAMAKAIRTICKECTAVGGVLLVQPEHLLSFQLMTLERSIAGDNAVARSLLKTQRYFEDRSRDIIDESDANFDPRFELIYTMGAQRQLDFSPDRWITIAEILQLVMQFCPEIATELPGSIEIKMGPAGSFPRIRILRMDAGRILVDRIGRHVCESGLPGLPVSRQNAATRDAVFAYITKAELSEAEIAMVENAGEDGCWTESVRPQLLLLRGLLACGILVFALQQKRWCVNYGLDSTRTPATRLAVPYQAKDRPSPRSDFSHPDVTILLTYLSYYYGYLGDDDMYLSFEHLMDSDSRDVEYQDWVQDLPELSPAHCHLQGINLKDAPTCVSVVFPKLSKVKAVIDYFLSNLVFPKELKVFPTKLCASGWDIGRVKRYPTTAFSGTCDAYPLLPLDVTQLDLPTQQHTNALVLDHLLRPGNSVALLAPEEDPESSDLDTLLSTVMTLPHVRVVLDVGAQILDCSNEEVARAWLNRHPASSAEAVIFFNEHDELCVLDRTGNVESLQMSPFAARKKACLVFLDEAHTRGTDIPLPQDYRAAVTLGPYLTKDRLVQACMRMRQLGQGQTIVFIVSPEIRMKIRGNSDADITVADVLRWAISETHEDIRRSMPLWAKQGKNFERQRSLWSEHESSSTLSSVHAALFLEDEAKGLEDRYRPRPSHQRHSSFPDISVASRVAEIQDRCQRMDVPAHFMNAMEEEQERELDPEMQEEKQIEKPAPARPAQHALHPDVIKFAIDGVFVPASDAYMSAFSSLSGVSAAENFRVDQLVGNELFVTRDFARTIDTSQPHTPDSYLRSVQWIITLPHSVIDHRPALIISPYEAQHLLPRLRHGGISTLHLYKPRWNVSYPALNRLDFCNFPTSSVSPPHSTNFYAQLDLFAGRTHFAEFEEYLETCSFLRLASRPADENLTTSLDGFILNDALSELHTTPRLQQSPVAFIKVLTSIRTHYRDFSKTDMGKLLSGVLLNLGDIGRGILR